MKRGQVSRGEAWKGVARGAGERVKVDGEKGVASRVSGRKGGEGEGANDMCGTHSVAPKIAPGL